MEEYANYHGGPVASAQAAREAAVPAQIVRLSEDAKQLEVLAEKLHGRLRTVLQEKQDLHPVEDKTPLPAQPCQLAHELFSLHDSIFRSNKVLQSILDKLEV